MEKRQTSAICPSFKDGVLISPCYFREYFKAYFDIFITFISLSWAGNNKFSRKDKMKTLFWILFKEFTFIGCYLRLQVDIFFSNLMILQSRQFLILIFDGGVKKTSAEIMILNSNKMRTFLRRKSITTIGSNARMKIIFLLKFRLIFWLAN